MNDVLGSNRWFEVFGPKVAQNEVFPITIKNQCMELTWFLYEVKQHKGLKLNKIFYAKGAPNWAQSKFY